ncbi:MAG: tRNA (adenosine(37)-N6)-threonylcarbamoyltransferase complex dimerization subunit type 1 TsaB [bacterium]
MKVLGLETSTLIGSVALIDSNGNCHEEAWDVGSAHSDAVFGSIDRILIRAKAHASDIDAVAVSLGPGSFTGIRIGVTIARTLGQVLGKPVAGISTLDVLAHNVAVSDVLICPVIDALRAEVYTALFEYSGKEKKLKKLTDYSIVEVDKLKSWIYSKNKKRYKHIVLVGPALDKYENILREKFKKTAVMGNKKDLFPHASTVAELGAKAVVDRRAQSWNKILPLYIRRSEAEVKWDQRNKVKK